MAIKFSQFTVRTSSSDLSHIVGYNGVDNIQITPTNFLNSALTGTAGQVLFYDTTGVTGDNDLYWDNTNKRLGIGTTSPSEKLHIEGGKMFIKHATTEQYNYQYGSGQPVWSFGGGNYFNIKQGGTTGFTVSSTLKVGIGTTSPSEKLEVNGNIKVGDSQQFVAGSGNDLRIIHDGTDSFINSNGSGDLYIQQFNDDKDIIFKSDNGGGGLTTYFYLDGSSGITRVSRNFRADDGVALQVGSSGDAGFFHNGADTFLKNDTGDLYIRNESDDRDIIFQCDNGAGSFTEYFKLDGSGVRTLFSKNIRLEDDVQLNIGSSDDLRLVHSPDNGFIQNFTGDLQISNFADDKDILFRCDDGSGGLTTYFYLDGSSTQIIYEKETKHQDSVKAKFGTSSDLNIYHNSSNSYIENNTNDLIILNNANDKDIVFQCDDGSGGVVTYFRLDGSIADGTYRYTKWDDYSVVSLGTGNDFQLFHDSTKSRIENLTGNLEITQKANDADIIFASDDGSGGTATYMYLDGGNTRVQFNKNARFVDSAKVMLGTSDDLQIQHDGSNSYISNNTGALYIQQFIDDGDIIFQCDDGSGGLATYFSVDGGGTDINFFKDTHHLDNVKAKFGSNTAGDLQIYHSGTHSFIDGSSGAGSLYLRPGAGGTIQLETISGADMISANATDVRFYSGGNERVRVKNIGINIQNVPTYADNAAAIAGGLTTGDVYRTGDLLKIVH